jgi:hypothetical protein
MNSLLQRMGEFIQVEALEHHVQCLKKKVEKMENDIKKGLGLQSDLANTRSALDRAAQALEKSLPRRRLTLDKMEVLHILGEGGWGTVWKVSETNPLKLKILKLGLNCQ